MCSENKECLNVNTAGIQLLLCSKCAQYHETHLVTCLLVHCIPYALGSCSAFRTLRWMSRYLITSSGSFPIEGSPSNIPSTACKQNNSSLIKVDGRLGLRLHGYHPIAPRPLRYRPFVLPLVPPVISRGAPHKATWQTSVSVGRNCARNGWSIWRAIPTSK
jgi:hypothetical protein